MSVLPSLTPAQLHILESKLKQDSKRAGDIVVRLFCAVFTVQFLGNINSQKKLKCLKTDYRQVLTQK